MGKTIAVDFDGVIHQYSRGWQEGLIYDIPVPGAFDAIQQLLNEGFAIVIHTTRQDHDAVRNWLYRNGAAWHSEVEVTNIKPKAIAYIDDRAVRFTNWSDIRKMFT